jgi:murein DD-endopeptidase MepM/ murein hydrolase activator NlpD
VKSAVLLLANQWRKKWDQKREKGWSGVTLLILQDNRADEPVRLRINQYVVYFALLLLAALPATALAITVNRHLREETVARQIEDRKGLLLNLPLLLAERRDLIARSREQIFDVAALADNSDDKLFQVWMESLSEDTDRPIAADQIVGMNLDELRRVRKNAENTLQDGAHHALRIFWHRFSVYHLTPRGRPLTKGLGFISSGFGSRPDPFGNPTGEQHSGMDFAAMPNSPIIATAPGVVIQTSKSDRPGYGLFVRIHHGLGFTSLYAHCSSLLVEVGDRVERGQTIALLGRTGRATGHHVHYEVRLGDDPAVNPLPYVIQK